MAAKADDELLQIGLGDSESLDVIRLESGHVLFVVSERGAVQRRTVARVSQRDAVRIARLIIGMEQDGR